MKIFDENPQARVLFTFGFAFAALLLIILAALAPMPLKVVFIALAVSDIIFLLIVTLGDKLPFKPR